MGKEGFALEFPSLPIYIFSHLHPFKIVYILLLETLSIFQDGLLPVIFSLLCFPILYLLGS